MAKLMGMVVVVGALMLSAHLGLALDHGMLVLNTHLHQSHQHLLHLGHHSA